MGFPGCLESYKTFTRMTTLTTRLDIHSETGDRECGNAITLDMDGSQPDCPVSFIVDGKPVFSLGSDEVHKFTEALESLVP